MDLRRRRRLLDRGRPARAADDVPPVRSRHAGTARQLRGRDHRAHRRRRAARRCHHGLPQRRAVRRARRQVGRRPSTWPKSFACWGCPRTARPDAVAVRRRRRSSVAGQRGAAARVRRRRGQDLPLDRQQRHHPLRRPRPRRAAVAGQHHPGPRRTQRDRAAAHRERRRSLFRLGRQPPVRADRSAAGFQPQRQRDRPAAAAGAGDGAARGSALVAVLSSATPTAVTTSNC